MQSRENLIGTFEACLTTVEAIVNSKKESGTNIMINQDDLAFHQAHIVQENPARPYFSFIVLYRP